MIILWIRKKKTDGQTCQQENVKNAFRKHDEDMKKFRFSHPGIVTRNPKDIMTTNGDVLAVVHNVKLTKHAQN